METILIVEDKEGLAKMLSQALSDAGYHTLWAKDGREGIATLSENHIDLIITDLKLPYKSGIDVLQAAKAHHTATPVIIMTAYGNFEIAVKAVKEGAFDFIAKPFERKSDGKTTAIDRELHFKRNLFNTTVFSKNHRKK